LIFHLSLIDFVTVTAAKSLLLIVGHLLFLAQIHGFLLFDLILLRVLFQARLPEAGADIEIPLIEPLITQYLTSIILSEFLIGLLIRLLFNLKFVKIIQVL